jgi:hypothetical protein
VSFRGHQEHLPPKVGFDYRLLRPTTHWNTHSTQLKPTTQPVGAGSSSFTRVSAAILLQSTHVFAIAGAFQHGPLRQYTHRWGFDHATLHRLGLGISDPRQDHSEARAALDGWQSCRLMRTSACALARGARESNESAAELATAENCDRIVEEIRYRNIRIPKQLDISVSRRVVMMWRGLVNACRGFLSFCFSIPKQLVAASRMKPSEWKATLAGWWTTIKHEGKHYWVRSITLSAMNADVQFKVGRAVGELPRITSAQNSLMCVRDQQLYAMRSCSPGVAWG